MGRSSPSQVAMGAAWSGPGRSVRRTRRAAATSRCAGKRLGQRSNQQPGPGFSLRDMEAGRGQVWGGGPPSPEKVSQEAYPVLGACRVSPQSPHLSPQQTPGWNRPGAGGRRGAPPWMWGWTAPRSLRALSHLRPQAPSPGRHKVNTDQPRPSCRPGASRQPPSVPIPDATL